MTTDEILELLPCNIVVPNNNPIDEWDESDVYDLVIEKDDKKFIITYYCWLKDKELIVFEDSLYDGLCKMYEWCKEKGYLTT